jgi:hypothetical protein
MPYLFDQEVEAAIANQVKLADAIKLKEKCEAVTADLLLNHPSPGNYLANDATAEALAASMGSKSRRDRGSTPTNAPHAIDYVGDDWRMVSDNAQIIYGKVSGELAHAYQLGLDIRSAVVIGKMYKLAVRVWSAIGQYTGYDQNEGKR